MGKGQQNLLPARVVPLGPPIVLRHAYGDAMQGDAMCYDQLLRVGTRTLA